MNLKRTSRYSTIGLLVMALILSLYNLLTSPSVFTDSTSKSKYGQDQQQDYQQQRQMQRLEQDQPHQLQNQQWQQLNPESAVYENEHSQYLNTRHQSASQQSPRDELSQIYQSKRHYILLERSQDSNFQYPIVISQPQQRLSSNSIGNGLQQTQNTNDNKFTLDMGDANDHLTQEVDRNNVRIGSMKKRTLKEKNALKRRMSRQIKSTASSKSKNEAPRASILRMLTTILYRGTFAGLIVFGTLFGAFTAKSMSSRTPFPQQHQIHQLYGPNQHENDIIFDSSNNTNTKTYGSFPSIKHDAHAHYNFFDFPRAAASRPKPVTRGVSNSSTIESESSEFSTRAFSSVSSWTGSQIEKFDV